MHKLSNSAFSELTLSLTQGLYGWHAVQSPLCCHKSNFVFLSWYKLFNKHCYFSSNPSWVHENNPKVTLQRNKLGMLSTRINGYMV